MILIPFLSICILSLWHFLKIWLLKFFERIIRYIYWIIDLGLNKLSISVYATVLVIWSQLGVARPLSIEALGLPVLLSIHSHELIQREFIISLFHLIILCSLILVYYMLIPNWCILLVFGQLHKELMLLLKFFVFI